MFFILLFECRRQGPVHRVNTSAMTQNYMSHTNEQVSVFISIGLGHPSPVAFCHIPKENPYIDGTDYIVISEM